jgi:hypothetical protein
MTTITLPPLPEPDCITEMGVEYHSAYLIRTYSRQIARLVLEGAAKCAEKQDYRHTSARPEIAADIRKLEVKHHE